MGTIDTMPIIDSEHNSSKPRDSPRICPERTCAVQPYVARDPCPLYLCPCDGHREEHSASAPMGLSSNLTLTCHEL